MSLNGVQDEVEKEQRQDDALTILLQQCHFHVPSWLGNSDQKNMAQKKRAGGSRIVLQTGRTGIEMNAKLDTFCVVFVCFFADVFRLCCVAGRSGWSGQPQYGHRCLPLHAGGQQRAYHAGIPGADDRLPVAALERLAQSHAGAPVFPTGGGGPLLAPRPRRRHALPNGPRLDSQRTGSSPFLSFLTLKRHHSLYLLFITHTHIHITDRLHYDPVFYNQRQGFYLYLSSFGGLRLFVMLIGGVSLIKSFFFVLFCFFNAGNSEYR